MLSSHALADDLGVFVDENVGLGAWLVHSSAGEGDEGRATKGLLGVEEGLGKHFLYLL